MHPLANLNDPPPILYPIRESGRAEVDGPRGRGVLFRLRESPRSDGWWQREVYSLAHERGQLKRLPDGRFIAAESENIYEIVRVISTRR